jgi:hypothetical protein
MHPKKHHSKSRRGSSKGLPSKICLEVNLEHNWPQVAPLFGQLQVTEGVALSLSRGEDIFLKNTIQRAETKVLRVLERR